MACYLEETETLSLEFPIGSLLMAATACLDCFIYDGLEHCLHVLSALNVPSQEPVIFRAQFDFESVRKLFSLANS